MHKLVYVGMRLFQLTLQNVSDSLKHVGAMFLIKIMAKNNPFVVKFSNASSSHVSVCADF